jgi:hypothetical protein
VALNCYLEHLGLIAAMVVVTMPGDAESATALIEPNRSNDALKR